VVIAMKDDRYMLDRTAPDGNIGSSSHIELLKKPWQTNISYVNRFQP
jgi:hypothetical protein